MTSVELFAEEPLTHRAPFRRLGDQQALIKRLPGRGGGCIQTIQTQHFGQRGSPSRTSKQPQWAPAREMPHRIANCAQLTPETRHQASSAAGARKWHIRPPLQATACCSITPVVEAAELVQADDNVVDRDENQLYKEADEPHNRKAHRRRKRDLAKLIAVRLCASLDQADAVPRELLRRLHNEVDRLHLATRG
eukprot:CAMPEP_0119407140 /NCGR_PEP_ID=MMETSP1335-20130426/1165_1 /TAXON_ID=259385 /ORGANISM="Chrysoculter rhomboideus, Strain RCC1486" /LENGTH=192 /DNA_ID=CAMNT_0007431233 /DNA_START=93 /DNA_END=669 /DNA_ORIENTATION=-